MWVVRAVLVSISGLESRLLGRAYEGLEGIRNSKDGVRRVEILYVSVAFRVHVPGF